MLVASRADSQGYRAGVDRFTHTSSTCSRRLVYPRTTCRDGRTGSASHSLCPRPAADRWARQRMEVLVPFPGPDGSSEIDLVVRQNPRGHTLAQASAREASLACPVASVHAILEEFFLSDQSNLIRSYPCRPMHVVTHSVRNCAASLGAYPAKTMHKLFSAPRLFDTPAQWFCYTSRTDEGTRQRQGLHPPNTMQMCHTRALRHADNSV